MLHHSCAGDSYCECQQQRKQQPAARHAAPCERPRVLSELASLRISVLRHQEGPNSLISIYTEVLVSTVHLPMRNAAKDAILQQKSGHASI